MVITFVSLNNVGMEVYFILTLLVVLGSVIGSFISVVSYRLPRGLNFIIGRSFCDTCKKELSWYDNIPLISYIFYHAKSRCCNSPISIRYPLIEISVALGFVALFLFSLPPVYYLLYITTLLILVIDLEYQIIPDFLSWIIICLALILSPQPMFNVLFSGFFASLFLEMLHLVTRGRGMGMGDIKLVIGLGMWIPLILTLKWLMLSFILGGIVASILLVLKWANLKTKLAFGPFLIVGFWATVLFIR